MTITIEGEAEARLQEAAERAGIEPCIYITRLLGRTLTGIPRISGAYIRPEKVPDWVYETLPEVSLPQSESGIHPFIGSWPGEESEAELLEMAQRIDDEDAGRV